MPENLIDDATSRRLFEEAEAEVNKLVNDAWKSNPAQPAFALGVLSGQAKLWLYELKLSHARAGKTYRTGFI